MPEFQHRDPLLLSIETPLRQTFYPLGTPLHIETNDRRVLAYAHASFGVFSKGESANRVFPGPTPDAAVLRMRFVQVPQTITQPPWPPAAFRLWRDLFAVVCGPDNFLTADLLRREVMGFFSSAMLEDREFFCWTFLECAAYVLLVRHFFAPVHAACVVRDGKGICLSGPAGAGKTCLAYACGRAGYALLSDDAVYLPLSEDTLPSGELPQIRGNPSRMRFQVSAVELFPELRGVPLTIRRERHEFLAVQSEEWFPERMVTQAQAGAVVFLERSPERSSSRAPEPVPATEAHQLLFQDLRLFDEATMVAHSRALERLVRVGAYRLRYATFEQALEQLEGITGPR